MLVCPLDLGRAHRQRLAHRPDRPEPVATPACPLEQVDVDADREDALRASDVAMPERLVGVQERAVLLEAALRMDHFLADHAAAAALHLVLLFHHWQPLSDRSHPGNQSTRVFPRRE